MMRVLIIEDNPTNLELINYLLTAFGHHSLIAHDGIEGFMLAEREAPDLILCDIQIPRLNGYELALRLKSHPRLCAIPLLAITACAMSSDRERILAAGFNAYIAKPINPETFIDEIKKFLPKTD
jgi:CheY-like chemotaxis protein